jgi:murein DD-endopeptidase MepM/ murein hydrolase activator NlpD
MKLVICSLFLFFITIRISAQSELEFASLQYADASSIEKRTEIDSIEIDSSLIGIKSFNWDTTKFNPFKEEIVKFPIQIKFKDSLYRSPILDSMVITSRYGWRNRRPHKGIDIDLITGDDVVSVLDGVVRFARYNSGHGKTVIVRHYNGLETVYAHLSSYAVKANDSVKRGQILGKGGATGNARGSHLHLIVNYKGIAINPEYLFDFNGGNKIRSNELWVTQRWTAPYFHSSRRQTKAELLKTKDEAIASLEKEKQVYVVKRGDTLSHISRKNNVSIRAICVANNIKSTTVLRVGQKLVLEM